MTHSAYSSTCHWMLPVGGVLDNPNYFYPPTAEINGKLSPVLTVVAFHATLPKEGIVFERRDLGEPWIRVK